MIRDPNPVEDAARWVSRLDQPAIDTAEGESFDRWMEADENHRRDFADIQALWHSKALIEALREVDSGPRRRPVRTLLADLRARVPQRMIAACAAVLAGLLVLPVLHFATSTTYASGHGAGRSIVLADGSRVDLNRDTELQVRILPWRRDATLVRGEAFFDISHDESRPFLVRSETTSVRVLGTAFDVDRQSSTRTVVQVYRGAVALASGADEGRVLRKGQGANVVGKRILAQPADFDVAARSKPEWQSGWFEAADVPIGVLVAKVQRYSARPIRFSDPALAERAISGRFRVSDPQRVLQTIKQAYDLQVRESREGVLISD